MALSQSLIKKNAAGIVFRPFNSSLKFLDTSSLISFHFHFISANITGTLEDLFPLFFTAIITSSYLDGLAAMEKVPSIMNPSIESRWLK
jgi:hypothetical protein